MSQAVRVAQVLNIEPYVAQLYDGLLDQPLTLSRIKEWSVAMLRVAYRLSEVEADQLQGLIESTPAQFFHPHWL